LDIVTPFHVAAPSVRPETPLEITATTNSPFVRVPMSNVNVFGELGLDVFCSVLLM
jgi:hypothetical protein